MVGINRTMKKKTQPYQMTLFIAMRLRPQSPIILFIYFLQQHSKVVGIKSCRKVTVI